MNVLFIDTGVASGISQWTSDRPDDVYSLELQRDEAEDYLMEKIPLCDVVGSEKLVISQATIRKGRQVQTSIEMVGLVRFLCRHHGVKHFEQMPAEAMRFATDDKLRRFNWHIKGGPDHQRDARRHMLTWCAENGYIDLLRLLPGA